MSAFVNMLIGFCFLINIFVCSLGGSELKSLAQGATELRKPLKLLGYIVDSNKIEVAYSPEEKATVSLFEADDNKLIKEDNDIKPIEQNATGRVTFTDLEPYTFYTLQIEPADGNTWRNLSVTLRTNTDKPSEIQHLHQTWAEPGVSVRFTWDEPKNPKGPIDGYLVMRCHSKRNCGDSTDSNETCSKEIDVERTRELVLEAELNSCYDSNVLVSAYNKPLKPITDMSDQNDYDKGKRKGPPKRTQLFKRAPGTSSAALIIFIVISVLLALLVCGYAGRKYYLKNYT